MPTNIWLNRLLVLCGPLSECFVFLFFFLCGLLPPPSPALEPPEVVKLYWQDRRTADVGIYLLRLASCLWPLYGIGVNIQLSRIPGVSSHLLAAQVASTCVTGAGLGLNAAVFSAVGYRPERDPAITQLASDLAWFLYFGPGSGITTQALCTSWVLLQDQRRKPLVPRWVAWCYPLLPIYMIPTEFLVHCSYDGPLAWNGALSFRVTWVVGLVSLAPMLVYLWVAAGTDQEEEWEGQEQKSLHVN